VRFSKAFDLRHMNDAAKAAGARWDIEPAALRRDRDGNLYVVDARNAMVFVFDSSMKLERAFGGHGTEPGKLRNPTDLAFSRDGRSIYVVDSDNGRVQVFDREGAHVSSFGEGRFRRAFGITAGVDGHLYVTDSAAHAILKFTEFGEYAASFAGFGVEHGQLWKPMGIAQDERGRLIVIDCGNHRAQIFDARGEWLVTFGTGRAYVNRERKGQ
jgi:DNA-binding beta-propeller fold protein YncE